MRKFTIIAVLLCAATLTGCVRDNDAKVNGNKTRVSLTAGIETRTDFSDPSAPKWSTGDAIGVHFVQADIVDNHHRLESYSEDGTLATFSGEVALDQGQYTIYGYYPHGELGDQTNHHATAKIEVPAIQRPTATSFDPAADVMVMWPITHDHNGTDIIHDGLQFKRALGMIRIVLDSQDLGAETIQNLAFTTDAGIELAGLGHFDLTDATFIEFYDGAATTITAEPDNVLANGTDAILLCVPPMTIPAGTILTITGETEGFTFEKSKTLDADITLEAGNWHTMNIELVGNEVTPKTSTLQFAEGHYTFYSTGIFPSTHLLDMVFTDGNGTELAMEIFTPDINMDSSVEVIDLPAGEYIVSNMMPNAYTIFPTSMTIRTYLYTIEGGTTKFNITGGSMNIEGDHNNYHITFNMIHSGGEFVAEFNGPMNLPNPKL